MEYLTKILTDTEHEHVCGVMENLCCSALDFVMELSGCSRDGVDHDVQCAAHFVRDSVIR